MRVVHVVNQRTTEMAEDKRDHGDDDYFDGGSHGLHYVLIALLVTGMDTEDRLAGIVVAVEYARTFLTITFRAFVGNRSQNFGFLADCKAGVLHELIMPQVQRFARSGPC
jgi:hypothetical protein